MRAITPVPRVYNPEDDAWHPDGLDEITFWPRITWLDCGTTTGLATIWFHPMRLLNPKLATTKAILAWHVNHTTGPENDQAVEILRYVRGIVGQEGCAVGMEKFTVQSIKKQESFLSSPRIAAKVDLGLFMGLRNEQKVMRRIAALWQDPSEIDKTARGDARLQGMQLWVPGADHRRDALKHCLLHLGKMRVAGMGAFEKVYGWTAEWEDAA
jgi:hypothetical protein